MLENTFLTSPGNTPGHTCLHLDAESRTDLLSAGKQAGAAAISSHAGIHKPVHEIGEQVDEDIGQPNRQQTPLDECVIPIGDGRDHQPAQARPAEDGFGDNGTGEQGAKLQANDGDDRDHRIGQRMSPDHGRFRKAFGAGGADVVLTQVLRAWRFAPCG